MSVKLIFVLASKMLIFILQLNKARPVSSMLSFQFSGQVAVLAVGKGLGRDYYCSEMTKTLTNYQSVTSLDIKDFNRGVMEGMEILILTQDMEIWTHGGINILMLDDC